VGQSVLIVPVGRRRRESGGGGDSVERREHPLDARRRTLYIASIPRVACVPEWSCLPLARDLRQPPGTIRRVDVFGGAMTIVRPRAGVAPGLSPDGET